MSNLFTMLIVIWITSKQCQHLFYLVTLGLVLNIWTLLKMRWGPQYTVSTRVEAGISIIIINGGTVGSQRAVTSFNGWRWSCSLNKSCEFDVWHTVKTWTWSPLSGTVAATPSLIIIYNPPLDPTTHLLIKLYFIDHGVLYIYFFVWKT